MNRNDAPHWREVQLDPQQWATIPESAGLWTNDPPDLSTELRHRTAEEIRLILHAEMLKAFTLQ